MRQRRDLYGTLQRLIEAGYVAEAPRAGPRMFNGRQRRYYRITQEGRDALNGDVERMQAGTPGGARLESGARAAK